MNPAGFTGRAHLPNRCFGGCDAEKEFRGDPVRLRRGGPGVEELGRLIRELTDVEAGLTAVDEVAIFSSELTRSGPIYEALGHAELNG